MKKLAEIGRTMWAYEKWREHSNIDLTSWQEELNPEEVVVMSPEERRKFARQLLVMFCKEWMSPHDTWREISQTLMSQIESMIKEQGL